MTQTSETSERLRDVIRRAWSGALGLDDFGDDDDFFVLGGHSLLVLDVLEQVEAETGVEVPLRAFFREPTVGALLRLVAE